jgi:xylulokinase
VRDLLIGLDIGTSAVKAVLFNLQGQALATHREPLVVFTPERGWAEQDPQDWWQGAQAALKAILTDADAGSVAAVGLCGQCPSHVLVDDGDQALGRAIIWRDRRARAEAEWIGTHISAEQAELWTGSPLLVDVTLPPARLRWLQTHRAEDWDRTRAVIQPKDYVGLQLTGKLATDINSAFCLAEAETGSYHPDYFKALDLPMEKLPPTIPPTGVLGEINRYAAALTGLVEGTPVVAGTIDAWCDTLGGGGSIPGTAIDVAGTSEIISLATDRRFHGQGVFLAELGTEVRFLCGPTQVGGESLRWLAEAFYAEASGVANFERLEADAAAIPPGSEGLIFMPYLDGERAPIWDPTARGSLIGLTLSHDRRHMARAVYEGVAFAVRHVLETCEEITEASAERVIACGGGSRSRFWNQVKADVLQRPVVPTVVQESACLGAAILAAVGVGKHESLSTASRHMVRLGEAVRPNPETETCYKMNYAAYRELYPALRPIYQMQFP